MPASPTALLPRHCLEEKKLLLREMLQQQYAQLGADLRLVRLADQQPTVQLNGRIYLSTLHTGTRLGQGLVEGQFSTPTAS